MWLQARVQIPELFWIMKHQILQMIILLLAAGCLYDYGGSRKNPPLSKETNSNIVG
jgi:hypothetical protein